MSEPLANIYKKSVDMEQLLEIWKAAHVITTIKKGDRQEALNNRLVSLTCISCKVMQKIIRKRAVEHLERSSFINNKWYWITDGKFCCPT